MLSSTPQRQARRTSALEPRTLLAVIWIDWYAYHNARLRALATHPLLRERVAGIELVGGEGVHRGLVFRATERDGLPLCTLMPEQSWVQAGQYELARRLWKKLEELQPEAVLVPGYYTLPALAALAWARCRKRKAILMTESTRADHKRRQLTEWIKGVFLTRAFQGAITGGIRQSAYMKDLGFSDRKLAGLYDVVDNDFFKETSDYHRNHSSRHQWGLPERYLLYVGRLAPEKNVAGLVAAFARYREGGGTSSLVLVGDGPEAPALREQAAHLGLTGSIVFAGLKGTSGIAPYYAFADWFVLPSWRDPWGLVVNEAMAAGLPVLVSNLVGCSDDLLEEGQNGFSFDPGDPDSLARLLQRLPAIPDSNRELMGQRSRAIISRYSPQLWAEEVVRIAGLTSSANHSAA